MPGVTNNEVKNNESDEPMVINGNASSSEMYIEGLPFESASVAGDPRYIWSAISVEAVDQFQVKTTAYSAEYQGLGVENFTIKSGTNQFHGSLYEIMRNTAFDSAGFNPAQYPSNYAIAAKQGQFYKPPEHMNEYGVTIGGQSGKTRSFSSPITWASGSPPSPRRRLKPFRHRRSCAATSRPRLVPKSDRQAFTPTKSSIPRRRYRAAAVTLERR